MKYETCKVDEIQEVAFFKDVVLRDGVIHSIQFMHDGASYMITNDYNGMRLSKNTDNLGTEYRLEGVINGFYIAPMYFETKIDAETKAANMTEAFITEIKRHKTLGYIVKYGEKETYISKDDEIIF